MKKFCIKLPIFTSWVDFVYECTDKEFCKKYWVDDTRVVWWLTITEKWCMPLIWIDNELDIWLVSHEIIHAVQALMSYRNINDKECFAYTFEFILNEYIKKIWITFNLK